MDSFGPGSPPERAAPANMAGQSARTGGARKRERPVPGSWCLTVSEDPRTMRRSMPPIRRPGWFAAALVLHAPWAIADAGGDAGVEGGGPPPALLLPGTQPGELVSPLREPSLCEACHGLYADYSANESWKGTMMANAARDPLFHAALTVANQDEPGAGDLCLRCHSPRAWLFGRSSPPRIDQLLAADFESVDCDFCHRLVTADDGSSFIGNGQYRVADDFVRRGPISDALAPHEWEFSAYHTESRLCGLCHDVSNPLRGGFPIERTYTEWLRSAFAAEGVTCQRCHLPAETGTACGASGMPERVVHRHELAGGNYWMPLVLAGELPELGRQAAYERAAASAEEKLRNAASLVIRAPEAVEPGASLDWVVRVQNETGHKLPTGYPEGRRCWLEVVVTDGMGRVLMHSGEYDSLRAERVADPQLRTYEVRLAAAGVEGFHFILQDEVLADTRIPPRGFVPDPETQPVGRSYPALPADGGGEVLAHWDEAPYSASVPADAPGPLTVRATLWYQTTSKEYVEALRDANVTDGAGERMHALWEKYDRAPPFEMTTVSRTVTVITVDSGAPAEAGLPQIGLPPIIDASMAIDATPDAAPIRAVASDGGCACATASRDGRSQRASIWTLVLIVSALCRRRR